MKNFSSSCVNAAIVIHLCGFIKTAAARETFLLAFKTRFKSGGTTGLPAAFSLP